MSLNEGEVALSGLKPGEGGRVVRIETVPEVTYKLMERGIGEGERITFIRAAPLGDPIEIELMGYRLSIRNSEADKIILTRISSAKDMK